MSVGVTIKQPWIWILGALALGYVIGGLVSEVAHHGWPH